MPKAKAALYIYRDESTGGAIILKVAVNRNPIGQINATTSLYEELAASNHTVSS